MLCKPFYLPQLWLLDDLFAEVAAQTREIEFLPVLIILTLEPHVIASKNLAFTPTSAIESTLELRHRWLDAFSASGPTHVEGMEEDNSTNFQILCGRCNAGCTKNAATQTEFLVCQTQDFR